MTWRASKALATALFLSGSPALAGAASDDPQSEAASDDAQPTEAASDDAQPKKGRIDLRVPDHAESTTRSAYMHNGFYLRMNVGMGSMRAVFDDDSPASFDLEASGFSLALDAMVGGSPSRGVALGGALLTAAALSAGFERQGVETGDRGIAWTMLGPFIDGFFDPRGGWHLGGMVGFARLDIEDDAGAAGFSRTQGVGGAAWGGYDFWVADEWSTGVLLRLAGAVARSEESGLDVSSSGFSTLVMFTGLYH